MEQLINPILPTHDENGDALYYYANPISGEVKTMPEWVSESADWFIRKPGERGYCSREDQLNMLPSVTQAADGSWINDGINNYIEGYD